MLTYVLSADGSPLMPTYNIRKVRHMLKDGRAVIAGHKPGLTIRLTYALPKQEAPRVQKVEICEDAGYQHIGVSVKSGKHEFAHEQYDLLTDEKQRHDDRRRYRRMRRNRLRYRKPRFGNRKRADDWLAPSLENKKQRHVDIVRMYQKVLPLTDVTVEVGTFDTQALEADAMGKDSPKGTDYQRGPRYRIATLREAVFLRDGYTCQVCGRSSFKDGAILRVHHLGFWKKDHSDRMGNLITVCTKCHTPVNHKPGGKLFGWEPKVKPMGGAAFMNAVRWQIAEQLRKDFPDIAVHTTYGTFTKLSARERCIRKTHANDAYCMGIFHPGHRAKGILYQKRRRNNRILEKFYDAKYIDLRDGTKKSGSQLSCGRTDRSESRHSEKDLRRWRGRKVSKGRRSIRRQHYTIQPGCVVRYRKRKQVTSGIHCHGTRVLIDGDSVAVKNIQLLYYAGAWIISKRKEVRA